MLPCVFRILRYHLYFLFDLMPGGDLMDVLVAEAKVIRRRVPQGGWQVGCLAPKVKMLQVCACVCGGGGIHLQGGGCRVDWGGDHTYGCSGCA